MVRASRRTGYEPERFIPYVKRLLEERNETAREASLRAGLDRSALWRFIRKGTRPHRDACILLAQHFGVNPNEMLQAAGYDRGGGRCVRRWARSSIPQGERRADILLDTSQQLVKGWMPLDGKQSLVVDLAAPEHRLEEPSLLERRGQRPDLPKGQQQCPYFVVVNLG